MNTTYVTKAGHVMEIEITGTATTTTRRYVDGRETMVNRYSGSQRKYLAPSVRAFIKAGGGLA